MATRAPDEGPDQDTTETKTAHFSSEFLRKGKLVRKQPALLVLSGPDAGLRIPLLQGIVVLGRTADADVAFPSDVQISRRHVRIEWRAADQTHVIGDLGSTNGTFVNDQRISEGVLREGDKIFVGQTILKYTVEDEVDSESGDLFHRYLFNDDLTGLVVKRRFDSEMQLNLKLAATRSESFAVLMMDMDGLKKVNDAHGHPVGASVIAEAGRRIGEICIPRGQVCRYGGDEFTAYLVKHTKKAALEIGESIRQAIHTRPFVRDKLSLILSISIGVSVYPDDGTTPEALSRAADEALYRAKAKGRNTVSA